jgi:hypothetical protein
MKNSLSWALLPIRSHGTALTVAEHNNKPVTLSGKEDSRTANLNVTAAPSGDSGSGGGRRRRWVTLCSSGKYHNDHANQIDNRLITNQPFELQHAGLQISIDPEALPSPVANGSIRVQSSVVTDPNALNTFFIQYPGQQGISERL